MQFVIHVPGVYRRDKCRKLFRFPLVTAITLINAWGIICSYLYLRATNLTLTYLYSFLFEILFYLFTYSFYLFTRIYMSHLFYRRYAEENVICIRVRVGFTYTYHVRICVCLYV